MMGQRQTLWKQSSESWGGRHNRLHYQGDCLPGSYSIFLPPGRRAPREDPPQGGRIYPREGVAAMMDDMFLEGKMEVGEEVRRQCHDPMLAPTPVLLARREVPARHPRATTTQLHHISEEMLVYRKHNLLSCQLPGSPKSTFLMVKGRLHPRRPQHLRQRGQHRSVHLYAGGTPANPVVCGLPPRLQRDSGLGLPRRGGARVGPQGRQ
ncbi:uncharacterized protein LOC126993403 [Eriocheir sinensis]|uniref:uncharacterized protein LOC126993403 n=1 Tax=Eriocheir sinensis TaxID=95602 RepID=UPI0021C5CA1D|nr:uncharacterized protein LOC126993403 [Eriocheir sinensis]